MLSLLLAVPSCIYSVWHGVISTSYFIYSDFYYAFTGKDAYSNSTPIMLIKINIMGAPHCSYVSMFVSLQHNVICLPWVVYIANEAAV